MALSISQAEDVIKSIRSGHGIVEGTLAYELDRNPAFAATMKEMHVNLQNAVKLLSEELNTKDAHCILEMVQNADDNHYDDGVHPKLSFALGSMRLRVDCNESGFSPANVRAICSVGQSTKPVEGYIGEKGIGFKSCWKVADVVHICSGNFSFKFDRKQELGMIAPILATFPLAERLEGHTQFLMDLQSADKQNQLRKEFMSLSPTLLMFLRRLQHLRVDFADGSYKEIKCEPGNESGMLSLTSKVKEIYTAELTSETTYVVTKYQMPAFVGEAKRIGVLNTEIVIAFPMSAKGEPLGKTQSVHAFLPLRDYGFEAVPNSSGFSPSREYILRCPWNQHLLFGMNEAFHMAVQRLNEVPSLRYKWVRYLPDRLPVSFLSPLSVSLRKTLSSSRVLWSWNETVEEPRSLVYIPTQYLDRHGIPLTTGVRPLERYLSPKYDYYVDWKFLESLGVTKYSAEDFLRDLRARLPFMTNRRCNAAQAWHEDVAKVLTSSAFANQKSEIARLAIIPLRNGPWISASSTKTPIFLDHGDETTIPSGIDIQLVHANATLHTERLKLFMALGIRRCNSREISDLILEKHRAGREQIGTGTEAVSHLVYLYKARGTPPSLSYTHVWVVDKYSKWKKPKDLYISLPGKDAFTHLFLNDPDCLDFIHPNYTSAISGDEQGDWLRWLVDTFGLSSAPRFIEQGTLSRAFRSIVKHHDSIKWLNDLKQLCRGYKFSISDRVREELSALKVNCANGTSRRLDETFFPTSELLEARQQFNVQSLPFIKVDDPENQGWIPLLKPLGVATTTTIGFYVGILQFDKEQGVRDRDKALQVYHALADHQDQILLRKQFTDHELILVASSSQPRWVGMAACVWKAPKTFRSKAILSQIWPECERFFRYSLQVGNATLSMVVDEIKNFSWTINTSEVEDLKSLLLTVAEFQLDGFKSSKVKELGIEACLPVRSPEARTGIRIVNSAQSFFIADRKYLHDCFDNKIPLLDFSVDEVQKLEKVLSLLNLDSKRLSVVVKEECRVAGSAQLDSKLTEKFKGKATALIRCVHQWHTSMNRQELNQLHSQLLALQVFRASEIVRRRSLSYRGQNIFIENDGELLLRGNPSGGLQIYLPEDEAKLQPVNQLHLPKEFAAFLKIPANSLFVGAVLQTDEAGIEKLLDYEGIPKLQRDNAHSPYAVDTLILPSEGRADAETAFARQYGKTPAQSERPTVIVDGAALQSRTESASMPNRDDAEELMIPMTRASKKRELSNGPKDTKLAEAMQSLDLSSLFVHRASAEWQSLPSTLLSNDAMNRNIQMAKERVAQQDYTIIEESSAPTEQVSLLDFAKYKPAKRKTKRPAIARQFERSEANVFLTAETSFPDLGEQSVSSKRPPMARQLDRSEANVSLAAEISIGALGEQFAFEYLRSAVPSFNEQHWTSNLKAYVKEHNDYKDIGTYNAPEKADFTFKDIQGQLTTFIINQGHKEAEPWLAQPPTYYLEVKSTTEGRDTPFSMSNYQTELAQTLKMSSEDPTDIPLAVYAILRVFNVNTHPDLDIYLDPTTLIAAGMLYSTPKDGTVVWPAS
ncbi:hypothetical protein MMC13_004206 [Lambiella insularis]|nr:hypothetical protein [Lambiella insularis]